MENNVNYKLMRLESSKCAEYMQAMQIYTKSVEYIQKTNTSEIKYWIDNKKKFSLGTLFFFVLLSNDNVIGYAELAYIKTSRILIIDYITIDERYNSNSAFYSFYWLIIDYICKQGLDYDFITKEILCKYDSANIYLSEIKMYELENFKVANELYIHPLLEKTNEESEKEALLLIYQKALDSHQIKSTTYLSIIDTIYSYYQAWDRPFINDSNYLEYNTRFTKYKEQITNSISSDHVIMNGYPKKHSFASEDKCIPSKSSSIRNGFIYTILVMILVFAVLFFAKEFNVEFTTIALIAIAVVFILFSFVALSDSKAAKIIKELPVFSKLFALLK